MNEMQYVNAIARKIKCSGAKKKEIKKQLLADIAMRTGEGESIKDIIAQMGSAAEVADSFNESISDSEQRKYARGRILKILLAVLTAFLLFLLAAYWILPKGNDIADSSYFNQAEVEEAMKRTIELIDAKDYDALQEMSILKMQSVMTKESIEQAKRMISDDWGERKQFGAAYIAEIVQKNDHFAVGEITVTYENASATFRLTYDEDMRLAGVYIR